MYSCFDCQRVLIINIWVSIESLYLWISDLRVAEESEIGAFDMNSEHKIVRKKRMFSDPSNISQYRIVTCAVTYVTGHCTCDDFIL